MKQKFTYHLHPDVTSEQYPHLPEDVRKVYISVIKKIPMDETEKINIIRSRPDFFIKRPVRTFGQAFKRLQNVKTMKSKIQKSNQSINQKSKQ